MCWKFYVSFSRERSISVPRLNCVLLSVNLMKVLALLPIRCVCFRVCCVVCNVALLLYSEINVIGQDKDQSSSERVVLKNTKVYSVLLC